ncbi:Bug family tripartite tricarboxylate transporter substrate binding protein [Candidimonas nitroreducens]|uniref:LacI family transcriptional regulator n=1 Tax=Candidimonas nitroreducens TaxID=683354 RepID=A0A225MKT9_9BURK|nr:tripartite tricarboxylate transporter substrate-binding protein [Candidimonas nitroreducens]OWT60141.1 LacI family transcriptional regulator [Candidimonas nitroreducens]
MAKNVEMKPGGKPPAGRRLAARQDSIGSTGKRRFLASAAALLAWNWPDAMARAFSAAPVKIIVPVPPGGASDILARLLSKSLTEIWRKPVIVENLAGATGMLGGAKVARSQPDGQTLLMGSNSGMIAPMLYSKPTFDPFRDLVPIVNVAWMPLCLIGATSLPANDIAGLIELVKRSPGRYSYASPGIGSVAHLAMEEFKSIAGLNIVHVPYRGAAPALQAVLTKEVALAFDSVVQSSPHQRAGQLKVYGVAGEHRSQMLAGVPTFAEAGLHEFSPSLWVGLFGPSAMPPALVAQINQAVGTALNRPDMQSKLTELGAQFSLLSPAAYKSFVQAEVGRGQSEIKRLGLKAG